MSKSTSKENDPKYIIAISRMLLKGNSISKIASDLQISRSVVSRIVANSSNFVDLKFALPSEQGLEADLMQKYGLANAIVVESQGIKANDEEMQGGKTSDQGEEEAKKLEKERYEISAVAHAAADYFRSNVKDVDSVALSCGRTLLTMTASLPPKIDKKLNIYQMSMMSHPENAPEAPLTITGLLAMKCLRDSTVYGIQLPQLKILKEEELNNLDKGEQSSREEEERLEKIEKLYWEEISGSLKVAGLRKHAKEASFVFMGVGDLDPKRGFGKIADKATGGHFKEWVKKFHLEAEINYQVLDRDGRDLTAKVPNLSPSLMHILSLSAIRDMAKDRDEHTVVIVAAGMRKAGPIRAALMGEYANMLITTREVAEELLK